MGEGSHGDLQRYQQSRLPSLATPRVISTTSQGADTTTTRPSSRSFLLEYLLLVPLPALKFLKSSHVPVVREGHVMSDEVQERLLASLADPQAMLPLPNGDLGAEVECRWKRASCPRTGQGNDSVICPLGMEALSNAICDTMNICRCRNYVLILTQQAGQIPTRPL